MTGASYKEWALILKKLKNAPKNMKKVISKINLQYFFIPAWTRILASNKMAKLTSVSLYSGCYVSISMVRKLTLDCPKLTFFSFIQSKEHNWQKKLELAEVERLRLECSRKNLNIKLCCLEMFENV